MTAPYPPTPQGVYDWYARNCWVAQPDVEPNQDPDDNLFDDMRYPPTSPFVPSP